MGIDKLTFAYFCRAWEGKEFSLNVYYDLCVCYTSIGCPVYLTPLGEAFTEEFGLMLKNSC